LGRIAIHLLGRPTVDVDGAAAPGPRGWKAWALLAYLVEAAGPVPRERLANLLFADADDPLGALRWNLAELRRALGPAVALAGDPIKLDLPPDTFIDVRVLGAATWVEAVQVPGLGRELLEGIDVLAGAAFETWLLAERRHIADLSAAVLREAATARLAMGASGQALDLATRLVALDEFDEEANVLLIRAFAAAGSPGRAREHLEVTTDRFRRELGTEPSISLRSALDMATELVPASPSLVQGAAAAESLITAGEAAVGAGVFESGLEILRRAAVVAREAEDPAVEARALIVTGTAYIHAGRGRSAEGATALHAGLQLAERIGNPDLIAEASRELGYLDMKVAHYERAVTWLERAIASAPDRGGRAAIRAIEGVVVADQGRTSEAAAYLREAAAIAADEDKPRLEAWALAFLARGHILREEWDAARPAASRAVELSRSSGWITFLALPQSLLAIVDLAEGRVDEASAAFQAAFALGCQIADPCWEGIAARGIGLVHLAHGRPDEAIAWLDDARTRCVRIPDAYLWVHAYCLDALCEAAIEIGRSEAGGWVRDLESVAARTGMNELLVRAQLHHARLGNPRALDAATLFADRIDNPVVLGKLRMRDALEVRSGS
jgi:DNA-binding SARP family transcriptional activator